LCHRIHEETTCEFQNLFNIYDDLKSLQYFFLVNLFMPPLHSLHSLQSAM